MKTYNCGGQQNPEKLSVWENIASKDIPSLESTRETTNVSKYIQFAQRETRSI